MPYTIGFSPIMKRGAEVNTGEAATATEALQEVRGLQASDEAIRFIRTPAGREISIWELELLAKEENKI
jgi:hypothetical protein